MKKTLLLLTAFFMITTFIAAERNPRALTSLVERIGGQGAAKRFVLEIDERISATNGQEVFVISTESGKPKICGSTLSAASTGLGWYLNHVAHKQISWTCPRVDLTNSPLPLPVQTERHECSAAVRHYLNYCTFSYSTPFWSWERWEQEIDWMALHGVNAPLQLVGTEVVWKRVLERLGYDRPRIDRFIAGPAFQAWFLMSNLEGWGGPNPDWWYARQERLARQILARERELGMEPILPGYGGMVPSDFGSENGRKSDAGMWCGFKRPGFLPPADPEFPGMAKLFYEELHKLMGTSRFYSIDLFHEGGNTAGIDIAASCREVYKAMQEASNGAVWVIQGWQGNPRKECLAAVPRGGLLVLDLFADGEPYWQNGFGGHDFVYCMLHNFGGRTGVHGRLKSTIKGYQEALARRPEALRGIGATPEGIETNPVLYDALFELPWTTIDSIPVWLHDYALARYGLTNDTIDEAWRLIEESALNCETRQQGTSEPVVCARPALQVKSVSTWSTSDIYYNTGKVRRAAALLLSQRDKLAHNENYRYDVVDLVRQSLTDEAYRLLGMADEASRSGTQSQPFASASDAFLNIVADLDKLLSTHPAFMLGTWTAEARRAAESESGTTPADADWAEQNARTLITTWGTERAANTGGLRDYSNREWGGLLRTFYLPRWERFFQALRKGEATPTPAEWFQMENSWIHNPGLAFPVEPAADPIRISQKLFSKHFGHI